MAAKKRTEALPRSIGCCPWCLHKKRQRPLLKYLRFLLADQECGQHQLYPRPDGEVFVEN